jgi:lysophospholipid acyltransferase (LPLAT)-like uncharacterized protein
VIAAAAAVVPHVYAGYMRFVEARWGHDDTLLAPLILGCADRHDRAIAALWHQEVFTVAWNYRRLHGHTLASVSDVGEIITRMLQRCNFVVFRGGSGSRSRKRDVLGLLTDHMLENPRVIYGLTVDGSNGPVHVTKPGAVLLARTCRAPLLAVRTWYSRSIILNNWDRSQIPLPFTRRVTLATGPYWIEPDADDARVESVRRHLDAELLELTALAHRRLGADASTPKLEAALGLPAGWTSRWPEGTMGRAHGPWDLDPEHPPPWANYPAGKRNSS